MVAVILLGMFGPPIGATLLHNIVYRMQGTFPSGARPQRRLLPWWLAVILFLASETLFFDQGARRLQTRSQPLEAFVAQTEVSRLISAASDFQCPGDTDDAQSGQIERPVLVTSEGALVQDWWIYAFPRAVVDDLEYGRLDHLPTVQFNGVVVLCYSSQRVKEIDLDYGSVPGIQQYVIAYALSVEGSQPRVIGRSARFWGSEPTRPASGPGVRYISEVTGDAPTPEAAVRSVLAPGPGWVE